jgi:hypothetical protein
MQEVSRPPEYARQTYAVGQPIVRIHRRHLRAEQQQAGVPMQVTFSLAMMRDAMVSACCGVKTRADVNVRKLIEEKGRGGVRMRSESSSGPGRRISKKDRPTQAVPSVTDLRVAG